MIGAWRPITSNNSHDGKPSVLKDRQALTIILDRLSMEKVNVWTSIVNRATDDIQIYSKAKVEFTAYDPIEKCQILVGGVGSKLCHSLPLQPDLLWLHGSYSKFFS